jgi:hypothetical protein
VIFAPGFPGHSVGGAGLKGGLVEHVLGHLKGDAAAVGGPMPTKIVRDAGTTPVSSLDEGVDATLRLVAGPALDGVTGRYFDGVAEASPHPQARDAEARRRLRDLSDQLCGLATAAEGPAQHSE